MTLENTDVSARYKDVVQLEKAGLGLPSHDGAEAALHDGAGNQILGRTAVRHWLDPDPDAIAGTWEFSTYGDASQAALETAGWTFSSCTASVTGGQLVIVKTGAYNTQEKAELTVNLTGDFMYVVPFYDSIVQTIARSGYATGWGIYVADSAGTANGITAGFSSGTTTFRGMKLGSYADLASGTAWSGTVNNSVQMLAIGRVSGTVIFGVGVTGCKLKDHNGVYSLSYGWRGTTQADASTFNRLILTASDGGKEYPGGKRAYNSIRRYA